MESREAVVEQIRAFNRFYTVLQGFLERDYLDTGYSVTQTRLLFELKQSSQASTGELIEKLGLDKGYISRLVSGLEEKGLVERQVSAQDGRARVIRLTPKGEEEAVRLIGRTNQQIARLIAPLSTEACGQVCAAMRTIMEHFQEEQEAPEVTIRTGEPGDPSRVCFFYYKLYEQQYHFNGTVESYFIKGMGELFDDLQGSRLWVAERAGTIVGSIAIVKRGEGEAQLRWFGVSAEIQGLGIGGKLLETAMEFCREQGYTHVSLWTIDILKPARHLYGKHGFSMTETKPNHQWADVPLLEEKWEYHAPPLCKG